MIVIVKHMNVTVSFF